MLCIATVAFSQTKKDTIFYESFSSKSLDRTAWNVEVSGTTSNQEQQAYVDSASVIEQRDGLLHIKPVYHPGYVSNRQKKYDLLSGRINTRAKVEFTYGTLSARVKMPAGDGLWPAFWALGQGKWPDSGEIDVMENIGDASWASHAVHGPGYFGNTPIIKRVTFPAGDDFTQWHVYSLNWTADALTFSIDGKITYTATKAMIEQYGRWAFDSPKYIILNLALGGGYPQGKNKVTTPYYGLPQATVDQIKAGKADFLVDWVLVTKN